MKGAIIAALAFLLCASFAPAAVLPDPQLTPGATTNVTAKQLCDPHFHTSSVRHVRHSDRVAVFKAYGIDCAKVNCGRDYEDDHLISLELGGSNDIKNLWPEPYSPNPGAHQKDVAENFLHRQVCTGHITLQDAQHQIATNWLAVYQRMTHAQQREASAPR